jgi:hypothetical protein
MEENNKKLYIQEGRILEYNEKAHKDTEQLLSEFTEDRFNKCIDNYSINSKEELERIGMIFPFKGNKLWLEVDVEDSYSASALYSWLLSRSNHDNTSGLLVFGCRLNLISWEKPSGYTEEEKNAVRTLYEKMFGDAK